ncbi:hypothetical protein [Glutamicibacter endophyticus]|uniref:hypothetical protein n=1 Tax=Glutamicibacter endophyticus TaxID=1522174 RepID=UPI003AEF20E0
MSKDKSNSTPKSIGWGLALFTGLLVGVTFTFLRTQRNFFIIGAAILAVVIIALGVATVRRRARYPQLFGAHTSAMYLLWSMFILVLAGPVQLVWVAYSLEQLMIKSLAVSLAFGIGIHEVDRALVRGARPPVSAADGRVDG